MGNKPFSYCFSRQEMSGLSRLEGRQGAPNNKDHL